jgi:hypothetical protein
MARLLTCGFEAGAIAAETSELGGIAVGGSAPFAYSTAQVRSGAKSVLVTGGAPSLTNYVQSLTGVSWTTSTTVFLRMAIYATSLPTTNDFFLILTDLSNLSGYGLQIGLSTAGIQVENFSNDATVFNAGALPLNAWHVLEASYVPSTGVTVVCLDGSVVGSGTVEPMQTATCFTSVFEPNGACNVYLDDWALNDNTGAQQNSWCGLGRVVFIKPVIDSARVGFTAGVPLAVNGSAFTAAAGNTTTAAFTVPSGLTTGELLVATVQVFNPGDAATLTPASGWSLAGGSNYQQTSTDNTADQWQVATFTKTYAGETGTETVCTASTAGPIQVAVATLLGAASVPVNVASVAHTTYSGSLPAASFIHPGVTTAQGGEMVIAACFNDQGCGYATPTGWTEIGAGVAGLALFYKIVPSYGATGSTTFTASAACDQTITEIAIYPPPLYSVVNHMPATAVAQGSATATSQIEDATSNATDYYQAGTLSANSAGIPKGSTIVLSQGWCSQGNSSSTSRVGSLWCTSNPASTSASGNTPAIAAGAWPTGWATLQTGYTYGPLINQASGSSLRFTKGTASTDYAMVAAMALLIEYLPPAPPKFSSNVSQAVMRAATR